MPDPTTYPYVIISPVKDEERHVTATLRSVVNQTIRPVKWIIVDDGSTDATPRILQQYAASHEWVQILRIERDSTRQLGITEIRAFSRGYDHITNLRWDFIVKLDGDLDLPPDYFERLLAEFQADDRLGIASGIYLEESNGAWLPAHMPEYHAAGASKFIRRKCFEDIGGFVLYRGWDTIDEIKALMHGWKTRHFPNLKFHHLRREGSAMGFSRTNMLHGEIYYLTGGGILFFLCKVLHRMLVGVPPVVGGLTMLWGYFKCRLTGRKRAVTALEARYYREMLNRRLLNKCQHLLGKSGVTEEVGRHN